MERVIRHLLVYWYRKLGGKKKGYITLPNFIFEGMGGIKASTAERRLRELREEYIEDWEYSCDLKIQGYKPGIPGENEWIFEAKFFVWLENRALAKRTRKIRIAIGSYVTVRRKSDAAELRGTIKKIYDNDTVEVEPEIGPTFRVSISDLKRGVIC